MMEIGILEFDGSRSAENALKDVLDARGDRDTWLHEIGVFARPLIGRLRVSASFLDSAKTYREGDMANTVADLGAYTGYLVSTLAGPFGSMIATVNAALAAGERGSEAKEKLFHIDEIRDKLPRDSSALVLVASPDTIDAMVDAFQSYEPKVIRRDVEEELRKRLETLHRRVAEGITARAEEAGTPAPH
jgi:hypothetical protein